jgi:glycosyltransferase involved in cell wall biosynthesis
VSPEVSVGITSYNQKDYLIEAIESVLNQTLQPHQVIIVDDCSTDGSQGVIVDYASRYPRLITPIFHGRNKGIARSRNEALRAVTGEFVTMLDGDDRFLPAKLEKEANLLVENRDASIAYSNFGYISAEGARADVWADNVMPPEGDVFYQVLARDFPRQNLFRNELVDHHAWERVGFYDPRFTSYEDYEMRIRLTKSLKVKYTGELLTEYRIGHSGSSLSNAGAAEHLANLEKIAQKSRNLLKDATPEQRKYVQRNLDIFLGDMAVRAMKRAIEGRGFVNNGFNSLKFYLKSLRYQNGKIDYGFALKLLLSSYKYPGMAFVGWDEDAGLMPEEGPYPEWDLPVIRWGVRPRTELRFTAHKKASSLSMICGPHHLSWQNVKVILNDREIGQMRFDNPGEFRTIEIPLEACVGHNRVILEYQNWDKTDSGRATALLFKQLRIVSR